MLGFGWFSFGKLTHAFEWIGMFSVINTEQYAENIIFSFLSVCLCLSKHQHAVKSEESQQ